MASYGAAIYFWITLTVDLKDLAIRLDGLYFWDREAFAPGAGGIANQSTLVLSAQFELEKLKRNLLQFNKP
jgi:hypothetical protein